MIIVFYSELSAMVFFILNSKDVEHAVFMSGILFSSYHDEGTSKHSTLKTKYFMINQGLFIISFIKPAKIILTTFFMKV